SGGGARGRGGPPDGWAAGGAAGPAGHGGTHRASSPLGRWAGDARSAGPASAAASLYVHADRPAPGVFRDAAGDRRLGSAESAPDPTLAHLCRIRARSAVTWSGWRSKAAWGLSRLWSALSGLRRWRWPRRP